MCTAPRLGYSVDDAVLQLTYAHVSLKLQWIQLSNVLAVLQRSSGPGQDRAHGSNGRLSAASYW